MIRYIVVLTLVLGCFSCQLGKKFHRPEVDLPLSFNNPDSIVSYGSGMFNDTLLTSLIDRALTHNFDMRIAYAKVREMAEQRKVSRSELFPQVDVRVGGEKKTGHSAGTPKLFARGELSWELDFWGNIRWRDEAALSAYMQTVEAANVVRLLLISDVARTYYELLALREEAAIVSQTLEIRKESVRLSKLRFEGGLTSETSYKQSLVEMARTKTYLPELEKKIALKKSELAFLIGEYRFDLPDIEIDSLQRPFFIEIPVGLPSTLLERRPDIRQSEQALRKASAMVNVRYTDRFPRFSLTGQYGLASGSLKDFLSIPTSLISGGILAPVFDMGKNKAEQAAAQAVYEQAELSYRESVMTAFQEVDDALVSVRKAGEITESQQQLVETAIDYLQLANLQYLNGVVKYLDVLDAQRQLFDARIALNRAILDEHLCLIQLYKALGGDS